MRIDKFELQDLNVTAQPREVVEHVESVHQHMLRQLEEQYRKEVLVELKKG